MSSLGSQESYIASEPVRCTERWKNSRSAGQPSCQSDTERGDGQSLIHLTRQMVSQSVSQTRRWTDFLSSSVRYNRHLADRQTDNQAVCRHPVSQTRRQPAGRPGDGEIGSGHSPKYRQPNRLSASWTDMETGRSSVSRSVTGSDTQRQTDTWPIRH